MGSGSGPDGEEVGGLVDEDPGDGGVVHPGLAQRGDEDLEEVVDGVAPDSRPARAGCSWRLPRRARCRRALRARTGGSARAGPGEAGPRTGGPGARGRSRRCRSRSDRRGRRSRCPGPCPGSPRRPRARTGPGRAGRPSSAKMSIAGWASTARWVKIGTPVADGRPGGGAVDPLVELGHPEPAAHADLDDARPTAGASDPHGDLVDELVDEVLDAWPARRTAARCPLRRSRWRRRCARRSSPRGTCSSRRRGRCRCRSRRRRWRRPRVRRSRGTPAASGRSPRTGPPGVFHHVVSSSEPGMP